MLIQTSALPDGLRSHFWFCRRHLLQLRGSLCGMVSSHKASGEHGKLPPPTPRSLSNAYDLLFGWRTRRHILHVWLLGHLSLRSLSSTFLAQKEQASPSLFCLTRNPHVIFLHVLRPVNPRPGCPRQRVLGKELHLNALDLHLYESYKTIKS